MPVADDAMEPARKHPRLAAAVRRLGQPALLGTGLLLWWWMGYSEAAALVSIALVLLLMEVLERVVPARPQWRLGGVQRLKLLGLYLAILLVTGAVLVAYEALLVPALSGPREVIGASPWPTAWPLLLQVVLLFFASDFIYYWIHRAIHRFGWFWRLSGHGVHHAFHNLHALNVGSTHPLEVLFLALPLVVLGAVFGAPGEAIAGATVLLVTNGTLAHANLDMDTPGLRLLVTTANQHRRHHSQVFEHSNSNYACNAIVWDRLFGTYSEGPVEQTGIGPTQPSYWQMLWMPLREPADADTAASRARTQRL